MVHNKKQIKVKENFQRIVQNIVRSRDHFRARDGVNHYLSCIFCEIKEETHLILIIEINKSEI